MLMSEQLTISKYSLRRMNKLIWTEAKITYACLTYHQILQFSKVIGGNQLKHTMRYTTLSSKLLTKGRIDIYCKHAQQLSFIDLTIYLILSEAPWFLNISL